MAKSTGSETWTEDCKTLEAYIQTNAKTIDKLGVMELNDYIAFGNQNLSRQNSITRTIKEKLRFLERQFSITSPFVSNQGKRTSFTLTDTQEAQLSELVSMTVNDDGSVDIHLSADAYGLHRTYSGKKNDDGSKVTTWGTTENMVSVVLTDRMRDNFIADVRSE